MPVRPSAEPITSEDAAMTILFHAGRIWRGTSEFSRSTTACLGTLAFEAARN
jgi:hypothetical protein